MPREWVAEAIVGGARPRVTSLPRLGASPIRWPDSRGLCGSIHGESVPTWGAKASLLPRVGTERRGGRGGKGGHFTELRRDSPPHASPPNIPPETNGAQEMIRCKIGRDARGSTPHKGPKPKGSPRSVAFRLVSASGSGAPNLEARRAVGHTPDGRKGEEGAKTSIIYVTVCVCCGGEGRPYLRAKSGSRGRVVRVAGG